MAQTPWTIRAAETCRRVAVALVARVWPGETQTSLEDRVAALPPVTQVGLVGGIIGVLFGFAIFSAQFGWVGLLVYGLVIVVLVG